MPGRGDTDKNGRPTGAYGETHSASRLYDYQCRRLNIRYERRRMVHQAFLSLGCALICWNFLKASAEF